MAVAHQPCKFLGQTISQARDGGMGYTQVTIETYPDRFIQAIHIARQQYDACTAISLVTWYLQIKRKQ